MMINTATLVGYLADDPMIRPLSDDNKLAKFRLGCNEYWTNKNGEKVERTHWINCTAFGKLAEFCSDRLKKGLRVGVTGRLNFNRWEKEGQVRTNVEIKVQDLLILTPLKS